MWKTIPEYPNYAVSNHGEVINKSTGNIKSIRVKSGYCFVGLSKKGAKKKQVSLHRLVALNFIPLIDGKNFVNHKDGNKLNCHYSNLEWCTRLENSQHAIRTGLRKPLLNRVKPVLQYDLSGNFIREWQSCRFAERELNFANGVISATAIGRDNRKQTGGFTWKFKDQVTPPLSQSE